MPDLSWTLVARVGVVLLLGAALTLGMGTGGCSGQPSAADLGSAGLALPEEPLPTGFVEYYQPVAVQVKPAAPDYQLPLDLSKVANPGVAEGLSPAQRALLEQNGFVMIPGGRRDEIISVYEGLEESGDPVWITPDALLHVFHIQFGSTLKEIEETRLFDDLLALTSALQETSRAQFESFSGELQEAAKRNLAYFTVARRLLEPQASAPASVAGVVEAELRLIEAHGGFSESPLFTYQEDYSQYVPRGHYTRSEKLQAYFKAMMWYGRMTFLLKGQDLDPGALVSAEEARRQTLQGVLISANLYGSAGPDSPAARWERIYRVTAFFAGFADDLTPRDYAEELREVAGAAFAWTALADPEMLAALRERLALLPQPQIYGGTGAQVLLPPLSAEQLQELLGNTQGLRLMGQRYIPDGYIFQQLIFPAVGTLLPAGQAEAQRSFTLVHTPAGPVRGFARGLDVMAVLGSDRAGEILTREADTAFERYQENMDKLQAEFAALEPETWMRNLYWGWIYALQALIEPRGEGYPRFMRTAAWEDRQLHAALASWAQLRHDTILYAKQPYAGITMAMPLPPAPRSPGFAEPLPEFYARLLALTRAMRTGLADLGVLPENAGRRMEATAQVLERLVELSVAELEARPLTAEQENFLENFSSALGRCVSDLDDDALKTTIVADVQTEPNSGQVLEQGTGYVHLLVGAYANAEGQIFLARGATLSYYEFKQPMDDRLTDEAWRERLEAAPPAPPLWVSSFTAG